ncbi:MAG: redox-sensing transcriptional repressor Rex [Actinomycetota bacterium]
MSNPPADRTRTGARVRTKPIPEATVARLPVYLRVLGELGVQQIQTVSSERLAEAAGVNPPKVRKDLSYLGSYGTRGVGYDVSYLVYQISRELGLTQDWPVAIVGMGNLGQALAGYKGFPERGFRISALFDKDEGRIGHKVGDLPIEHIDDLERSLKEKDISIAIIATPAPAAQETAERLVAAGVRSVLNFAPTVLTVPDKIHLRQVDLSVELQILAFYEQRGSTRKAPKA